MKLPYCFTVTRGGSSKSTTGVRAATKSCYTADWPTPDTPTADTPTADTPTADCPTADTPTADTPTADTPTADTPTQTPLPQTPCEGSQSPTAPIQTPWEGTGEAGEISKAGGATFDSLEINGSALDKYSFLKPLPNVPRGKKKIWSPWRRKQKVQNIQQGSQQSLSSRDVVHMSAPPPASFQSSISPETAAKLRRRMIELESRPYGSGAFHGFALSSFESSEAYPFEQQSMMYPRSGLVDVEHSCGTLALRGVTNLHTVSDIPPAVA